MNVTIEQTGPADYELRISAPSELLEPKLLSELKKYRGRVQMRGFRPGRVPVGMLRKMYGAEVAAELAEREIQETFDLEVIENPEYDVIGAPVITEMTYDGTGDLSAVVAFGVRPTVEIGDLSDLQINRLTHEVTEEEIDEQIDELRARQATFEDAPEGTEAAKDHFVTVDIARLDDAGEPIDGETEEGVRFQLGDDKVKDELEEALLGKTVGDTFDVTLPQFEDEGSPAHPYRVTLVTIETQTLPDVTDEFARKASGGSKETIDELRADIRQDLERSWQKRSREYMETQFVDALTERYPIDVPASAVAIFQDAFVQRAREQLGGQLPKGFDLTGLRERMRPEAEEQARWMILRDALVTREGIEIGDDDLDAHFAEMAGDEIDPALLRNYYAQQEGVMGQLVGQIQSERLFDRLATQVALTDVTQEEAETDLRTRREKRAADQKARGAAADERTAEPDAAGEEAEEQEG
jgi:trigger factor